MIATARTLHAMPRYPVRDTTTNRVTVVCGRCLWSAYAAGCYTKTTQERPELTACSICGQPLVSPRKDARR